jgi:hypothetical protein
MIATRKEDPPVPTLAEEIARMCEKQDQMMSHVLQAMADNQQVIIGNTEVLTAVKEMVRSIENTVKTQSDQLSKLRDGVPMRVFLLVVGSIIVVMFSVLGVKAIDVVELLKGAQ